MSNVTLQNGNACSVAGGVNVGGAIYVRGTATLSDCTFSQNTIQGMAGFGGAIYIYGGPVMLSNCIFSANTAPGQYGYGGAIFIYGGSNVTLSDCIFSENTAPGYGGGALAFDTNSNSLLKNCSHLGTVSPKRTMKSSASTDRHKTISPTSPSRVRTARWVLPCR
jgi:hypothetical protein